ncbi:MAG: hypothetical protein SVE93_07535 [Candidatus Thermoplasmatota archaeon]|nr:hypothetical protein [Candidatus Thermoplasmatota archaeon]
MIMGLWAFMKFHSDSNPDDGLYDTISGYTGASMHPNDNCPCRDCEKGKNARG